MTNPVTSVGISSYYPGVFETLRRYDPNFIRMVSNPIDLVEKYFLLEEEFKGSAAPHLIFVIQQPQMGMLASFTSDKHELNQKVSLDFERHLGTEFRNPLQGVLEHYRPGLMLNGIIFKMAMDRGFEIARRGLEGFGSNLN